MSKRESIARYSLIIKKLRRGPATFGQINDKLKQESELQDYNFMVSKRTFQRDLDDIRSIYDIDIQFDFSRRVYFIESDHSDDVSQRILEAYDTFNALSVSDRLSDFIFFDERKPRGSEYLYGILYAIRNSLQLEIEYKKYWDNESRERTLEPYALKEFRNHWYLVAFDPNDGNVKTYSLDRIHDLTITKRKAINKPESFNVHEYFAGSFGITRPHDRKPEKIELRFTPWQGHFIRALPLHKSQQIITDNDEEFRIRLEVYITDDFVMELLSFGDEVKVVKPAGLVRKVKEYYKNALKKYSKED